MKKPGSPLGKRRLPSGQPTETLPDLPLEQGVERLPLSSDEFPDLSPPLAETGEIVEGDGQVPAEVGTPGKKPASAAGTDARPIAAPQLPMGILKMPARVLLVPPTSEPYPADPSRKRHPTNWELVDADTGVRIYADPNEGLLRKMAADGGSIIT